MVGTESCERTLIIKRGCAAHACSACKHLTIIDRFKVGGIVRRAGEDGICFACSPHVALWFVTCKKMQLSVGVRPVLQPRFVRFQSTSIYFEGARQQRVVL